MVGNEESCDSNVTQSFELPSYVKKLHNDLSSKIIFTDLMETTQLRLSLKEKWLKPPTCKRICYLVIYFLYINNIQITFYHMENFNTWRNASRRIWSVREVYFYRMRNEQPWLVWLSGLSAGRWTAELPVHLLVKVPAWVVGWVPGCGCVRSDQLMWHSCHTPVFLSLPFFLPLFPVSKNK